MLILWLDFYVQGNIIGLFYLIIFYAGIYWTRLMEIRKRMSTQGL